MKPHKKNQPAPQTKNSTTKNSREKLNSQDGLGKKEIPSAGAVQNQDPKRRLGQFQGTGEHARTGKRGQ